MPIAIEVVRHMGTNKNLCYGLMNWDFMKIESS